MYDDDVVREVELHVSKKAAPEITMDNGLLNPTRSYKMMLRARQQEGMVAGKEKKYIYA